MLAYLQTHSISWATIGWCIGVWIAIATIVVRLVPKPAPPSKWVYVYTMAIDLPAAWASRNSVATRGVVLRVAGHDIPVPGFSFSRVIAGPPPSASAALIAASAVAAKRDKEAGGTVLLLLATIAGAALAILLGLWLFGCTATALANYDKATGSTAVICTGGYRARAVFDGAAQAKIQAQARSGDAIGAAQALVAHLDRYRQAGVALDACAALVEGAQRARPLVEMAKDRDKQAADWIAKLVAVGAQLVQVLASSGIPGAAALVGGGP